MDHVQRERKVNLEKFPREDQDRIISELINQIKSMTGQVQDEINSLLNIYGFRAEVRADLFDINAKPETINKPKKGRPKKVK